MRGHLKSLAGLMGLIALVGGCTSGQGVELAMAAHSEMPVEVRQAPDTVAEAYQFAVANPETVSEIPCYCGCGAIGHTSNYSCYAEGTVAEGDLVFDNHALGCGICVDITQDTMRLTRLGKSIAEIQEYVHGRYAKYGEPTVSLTN